MARQRVQTQYDSNQVSLTPVAQTVNTYVRPTKDNQLSRALEQAAGTVFKRVEEQERLQTVQDSAYAKRMQAQTIEQFKNVIKKPEFADDPNMNAEGFFGHPDVQELLTSNLSGIQDPLLKQEVQDNLTSIFTPVMQQHFHLGQQRQYDENTSKVFMSTYTAYSNNPETKPGDFNKLIKQFDTDLRSGDYGLSKQQSLNSLARIAQTEGRLGLMPHVGNYLLEKGLGGTEYQANVIEYVSAATEKIKAAELKKIQEAWSNSIGEATYAQISGGGGLQDITSPWGKTVTVKEQKQAAVEHLNFSVETAYKEAMTTAKTLFEEGSSEFEAAKVLAGEEAQRTMYEWHTKNNIENPEWSSEINAATARIHTYTDETNPKGQQAILRGMERMQQLFKSAPNYFNTFVSEADQELFHTYTSLTMFGATQPEALSMIANKINGNIEVDLQGVQEQAATIVDDVNDWWFKTGPGARHLRPKVERMITAALTYNPNADPEKVLEIAKDRIEAMTVVVGNSRLDKSRIQGMPPQDFADAIPSFVAYLKETNEGLAVYMSGIDIDDVGVAYSHQSKGINYFTLYSEEGKMPGTSSFTIEDIKKAAMWQRNQVLTSNKEFKKQADETKKWAAENTPLQQLINKQVRQSEGE